MYCENVSAKPDSGRAITHSRVSSQNGSRLVTMSRIVPRGSTAYASVKTARSVVSSVCAGQPAASARSSSCISPPQQPPSWGGVQVDRYAAQPGLPDRAGERTPGVGRDRVLWCSRASRRRTSSSGANTHRSASAPTAIRPLRSSPTRSAGRRRHPARPRRRARARGRGLGPHRRQPELQRRDAAPGLAEVAGVESLELRRARRVVGDHEVDVAVGERRPEQLAVGGVADRRAALELGGAVRDRPRRRSAGSAGRSRP